ncbi:hypothetical protein AGIG_G21733 [Arapaima gigas]
MLNQESHNIGFLNEDCGKCIPDLADNYNETGMTGGERCSRKAGAEDGQQPGSGGTWDVTEKPQKGRKEHKTVSLRQTDTKGGTGGRDLKAAAHTSGDTSGGLQSLKTST